MSDTPRTDALARKWSMKGGNRNGCDVSPESREVYDLAEELERENAALRQQLAEAERRGMLRAAELCYTEATDCAATCDDSWQNGALMCAKTIEAEAKK